MCGGACACWFSRTHKCITFSTTEAEYIAMVDAMKEVMFLQQVWCFMLPGVSISCVPVFEDNEGAVQLVQMPVTNPNSRHIEVRHNFLRDLVAKETISITHVRSAWQHVDFLMKPLSAEAFQSLCTLLKNTGWF